MRKRVLLPVLMMVAASACQADREAAEQIDPGPDPAIEQAPAMPTPPVGVPAPGSPEARERLDPDTLPVDTVSLDTAPALRQQNP